MEGVAGGPVFGPVFIRVKTTEGTVLLINSADIITAMEVQDMGRPESPVHLEMRQREDLEVVSPLFEELEQILLPLNRPHMWA